MPFAEQLLRSVRIDPDTDCWVWIAIQDRHGYGRVSARQEMRAAHRWTFENLVGPIPDGAQLDHLCRRPLCVNPAHLEAVSQEVNIVRGVVARENYDPRLTCPSGHPRDLYGRRGGARNARYCESCGREFYPWAMHRHQGSKKRQPQERCDVAS